METNKDKIRQLFYSAQAENIELALIMQQNTIKLNFIHRLPAGLWLLPNLTELYVEQFTFSAIPPEIGLLSKLQKLNFHYGFSCRKLPAEIGNLQNLISLDLDNNAIEELPESIGKLQKLELLSLRANCLYALPDEMIELKALKKFYLAQNQLQKMLVPTFLFNKTKTNPVIVATLRRVFKV